MVRESQEVTEYRLAQSKLDAARGCLNGIILGALMIGLVAVTIWAASS